MGVLPIDPPEPSIANVTIMLPVRLAVTTRLWKAPLAEILDDLEGSPVDGLQFDLREELPCGSLTDSGRRDLLHRLRERGLALASAWVPLRHPLYAEYALDRRVAYLREAITFAAQLRIPTLCLSCGPLPETLETGPGRTLIEILNDLCTHGNHQGVTVAIASTDPPARLRDLLQQVTTGPVGIDFDPAYYAMSGSGVTETLKQLHPYISHVQLRDGVRDFTGGGQETAVGQGVVDWPELLATLGEMDYRGWLTAVRTQGDDRTGDVLRAVTQIRKVLLGS